MCQFTFVALLEEAVGKFNSSRCLLECVSQLESASEGSLRLHSAAYAASLEAGTRALHRYDYPKAVRSDCSCSLAGEIRQSFLLSRYECAMQIQEGERYHTVLSSTGYSITGCVAEMNSTLLLINGLISSELGSGQMSDQLTLSDLNNPFTFSLIDIPCGLIFIIIVVNLRCLCDCAYQ